VTRWSHLPLCAMPPDLRPQSETSAKQTASGQVFVFLQHQELWVGLQTAARCYQPSRRVHHPQTHTSLAAAGLGSEGPALWGLGTLWLRGVAGVWERSGQGGRCSSPGSRPARRRVRVRLPSAFPSVGGSPSKAGAGDGQLSQLCPHPQVPDTGEKDGAWAGGRLSAAAAAAH